MNTQHRPGVRENCLVIRHLKLENLDHEKADAIGHELDRLIGVDGVSFNESESLLNVAYDADKLNIDAVEAVVRKHGADIAHGWWTTFKEDWYRYIDQNVRDNYRDKPWSCHQNSNGR